MPYERPRGEFRFAAAEREILEFWRSRQIFARSLEQRKGAPEFVFYEGPPTANGLPHNGHVLTRVVKDLFPRYKAMRGYYVPRKAGWDTHGLPVEVEVEKELGIHGKAEIERYGVEPFTKRCIESVFRYTKEWETLTDRVGFWIDLSQAYVTYHRPFVESVWWALSRLFERGLLYQGHKVVWWWPQGGTALSSAEVGLGYRPVDDPEVVVRFKSRTRTGVSYLAWTTTPWTLPSNVGLAVHPEIEYVRARIEREGHPTEDVIVAAALVERVLGDSGVRVIERCPGKALVGDRYEPLFDYVRPESGKLHEIVPAAFVGANDGTGIVHCATGFGEDDFSLTRTHGLALLQLVKPDGTFPEEVTDFKGRYIKEADRDIIRHLKGRGLVFREGTYHHDYPFCWRASSDPLIQYARPAWFIRTTAEIQHAIANNRAVNWLPEAIKEGRFGDFLANNVDWALSRERYWGTPLPIWTCDACGTQESLSKLEQAVQRNPAALDHWHAAKRREPALSEHLVVHKPWIDAVTFGCAKCSGTMRRVPDVIDCWFDSGCMPFAQWGFPHTGIEQFRRSFPADFISEAIDQTRGWFYSLLMISTLVFDEECQREFGLAPLRKYPHPFKTCIVLGHVCDPEGKKESKSSGNYTSPDLVLEGKFQLQIAPASRLKHPIAPDAAVLLPAQVKTLGLQDGALLRLRNPQQPQLTVQAKLASGAAGKEATVLGDQILQALRLQPGQAVLIDVLDDPPGADAFRWFFFSSGPPWNNTRNSLRAIRDGQNEFLVRWSNVLSFFLIYASIDRFEPQPDRRECDPDGVAFARLPLLDRWILSELALTARDVTAAMDDYRIYEAASRLRDFVDGLSNWYVRRSRDRFWKGTLDDPDKRSAYETLWRALVGLSQVAAPFVPYLAEHTWRTLTCVDWAKQQIDSVHLSNWPNYPASWIDQSLSRAMALARETVSLGLSARASNKIRVRQPLQAARVFVADPADRAALQSLSQVIAEELNVKQVEFGADADRYVEWKMQPNFRAIGPKYGTLVPALKQALQTADAATLRHALDRDGAIRLTVQGQPVELGPDEISISLSAKEHYAAASSPRVVVVLETDLDPALLREGLARELINRLQSIRKDLDLDYTDRIAVSCEVGEVDRAALEALLADHGAMVSEETLAVSLRAESAGAHQLVKEDQLEGLAVRLGVSRAPSTR
jgi:isoleucyl-tRNA synthetase